MIEQLGQILVSCGAIRRDTLDRALLFQQEEKASGAGYHRIGECLVKKFNVPEESVYKALAAQFGLPFLTEIEGLINRDLMSEMSFETLKEVDCLPLERNDDVLKLVVSDPVDLTSLLMVQAATGLLVDCSLTSPSKMAAAKKKLYEGASFLKQSVGKISREYERQAQGDESLSLEEIKKRTESEPVVKMVSLIFDEAIKLNASDVHIEPTEHNAVVRYRIDGMLTQHTETTHSMYVPITSRIKIMADLDIAEKRVPQDGRIRYTHQGETYDFRVSTLPTHHGEKTVVRILAHDAGLLELSHIGMGPAEYATLSELIQKPQGMIFVTGPTGSGKSSTLFACLNRIRTKAINITTIENPIEYKVQGVNQVQINEKAGVTFAATLRSILRQDPDAILIGEIRDRETAEIAVQAAQTGHLVLSTLHTNDAIAAITRLRDLGVPGFLISSSLLGILAQRLVRVLCPVCKKRADKKGEALSRWKAMLPGIPMPEHFVPEGCEACHKSGFKGRTGIFELAAVNDAIREMISENATDGALRAHFRGIGMKTMIQNGVEKIQQGITSPDELLRVVMVEDILGLKRSVSDNEKELV
ncbi:MAG TPA: GspE/PulE family protein [Chitinivibrionales bacterium]|nr:GspE/PulE family protein [Chitinivibrionales bacterium]